MIVPFSHDQPRPCLSHSEIGIGNDFGQVQLHIRPVVGKLREILDGRYDQRAKELGLLIQREDGVDEACRICRWIGREYAEQVRRIVGKRGCLEDFPPFGEGAV